MSTQWILTFALATVAAGFGLAAELKPQKVVDDRFEVALTAAAHAELNALAKAWIAAELDWTEDPRKRAGRDTAHEQFQAALKKYGEQKVLSHVGDLLAIFSHVFSYPEGATSGKLQRIPGPNPFHIKPPRRYDPKTDYASVLVLRGRDAKTGKWKRPAYLDKAWRNSTAYWDTFLVLPDMIEKLDYDAVLDPADKVENAHEFQRIRSVLACFGAVNRSYRLDRSRMFLDCGPGTCGFGLRLATYFPSHFAGIILRQPVSVGPLRLDNLAGKPILLISTPGTAAAAKALQSTLDGLAPGHVKVVTGKGEAPFVNAGPEIDLWMRKHRRPLFPAEVRIVPNHDRFHRQHWALILKCAPITAAKRPVLRVRADRKTNRIHVDSTGVTDVALLLNDALVDLDAEVTFIVNGKTVEKTRVERTMVNLGRQLRQRYDPNCLYPAYHRLRLDTGLK